MVVGDAEGVLAATVALLEYNSLPDRDAMRLRFHVINDDASVSGQAVLRWRLKSLEPAGWLPFLRAGFLMHCAGFVLLAW